MPGAGRVKVNQSVYIEPLHTDSSDSTGPRNSPRQSAIAEGFAESNSVFIIIISAKVLPR